MKTQAVVEPILKPIALREPFQGDEHPFQALKPVYASARSSSEGQVRVLNGRIEHVQKLIRQGTETFDQSFSVVQERREDITYRDIFQQLVRGISLYREGIKTLRDTLSHNSVDLELKVLFKDLINDLAKFKKKAHFGNRIIDVDQLISGFFKFYRDSDQEWSDFYNLAAKFRDGLPKEMQAPFNSHFLSLIQRRESPTEQAIDNFVRDCSKKKISNTSAFRTLTAFSKLPVNFSSLNMNSEILSTLTEYIGSNAKDEKANLAVIQYKLSEIQRKLPDLEKKITRNMLTGQLDPASQNIDIDTTRYIPTPLKGLTIGLAIGKSGEILEHQDRADKQRLIIKLADLLETEPSISERRLAPVLRALLPEAKLLLQERSLEKAKLELALQREREISEQSLSENLGFIELFFDEELSPYLPDNNQIKEVLRRQFLFRYGDPVKIIQRQELIKQHCSEIGLSDQDLKNHYELFLLTDKELNRWAQHLKSYRDELMRTNPSTVGLIFADYTNILPSVMQNKVSQESSEPAQV